MGGRWAHGMRENPTRQAGSGRGRVTRVAGSVQQWTDVDGHLFVGEQGSIIGSAAAVAPGEAPAFLQNLCLEHDGFALPANFGGDLEGIPPHQLSSEQLYRKGSLVLLFGQLPENALQRCDPVARNQP